MQKYILKDAVAPITGDAFNSETINWSVQASVVGTGAVAASVEIQVSNDGVGWLGIGTITLSGTDNASDGFAVAAPWQQVRAKLDSISGTNAKVYVSTCK